VKKDGPDETVLSVEQDAWYKTTIFMNFGDLGMEVKKYVEEYQKKTQMNQNIDTIEDIKRFIEAFPEFRKLSGNVTKHVTLVGELSRIVDQRKLLKVSELEQSLANTSDHAMHVQYVKQSIDETREDKEVFAMIDKLKLAMLYALRYELSPTNELPAIRDLLTKAGATPDQIKSVAALLQYAGASARGGDLFGNKKLVSLFSNTIKELKRGIKGVANIYTEHQPVLRTILNRLLANDLPITDFPYTVGQPLKQPPQEIIVFIVGGATYEEGFVVHDLNSTKPGVRIILGGTNIQNSQSFIRDVSEIPSFSSRP